MGKGNGSYRRILKLGSIINTLPSTDGKPYQDCSKEQRARMMLELAWKEMSGSTYTDQWFEENKQFL